MTKSRIIDAVTSGRVLVSDGAWGTFLQRKGLQPGECPELWCIDHRDIVLDIARSYVAAGADMIQTNTLGGSRLKLAHFGLTERVDEINRAAAVISREAAGEDVWVIASIGPTGKMTAMGDVTEEDFYDVFAQQAQALIEGGADAVCIETMSALDEASAAVRAAHDTVGCEIICTFTFEKTMQGDYRTMMGVTPEDAVSVALEAGADIVGANCGNGMERMVDIVELMRRAAPEIPILVHANAGMPRQVGASVEFPETPEMMAGWVPRLVDAGANIIGGCCGTTPAHIAAIRRGLGGLE